MTSNEQTVTFGRYCTFDFDFIVLDTQCSETETSLSQNVPNFQYILYKENGGDLDHRRGLYMGFRDTGYLPFYFQGYGILCSIFSLLSGILNS